MGIVLTVEGLRKSYGDVNAVDGVDFLVSGGEILGLLGPNGAGKTTTLECVEGLLCPDGGRINIRGLDPQRDRRRMRDLVGVQLQTAALPGTMTVGDAMRFVSAYHGCQPREDLLGRMDLAELHARKYSELSVGQQRRLALVLAIVHRPALLFLDEPTAGLDVKSRRELHTIIAELREQGTAIVLATHDMAEAEKLSDRLAIMLAGRIVAEGTPREITATGDGLTKVSVATEGGLLIGADLVFPAAQTPFADEQYLVCFSTDPGETVKGVLDAVAARGDRLVDLRVERPSLEERFLEVTEVAS